MNWKICVIIHIYSKIGSYIDKNGVDPTVFANEWLPPREATIKSFSSSRTT